MNSPKKQIIFEEKTHEEVRQDKKPPRRITAGTGEPVSATLVADLTSPDRQNLPPAVNRPKHHGSETRQTLQISGRVKPHLKSEVARLSKLKGWTESRTVATLVESALAGNLAEQFGVMLKKTLQEAVTTQLQKDDKRAGNLALEAFHSAEESRVLTVYLIRLILGPDIDVLPQLIKDAQAQARENVAQALAAHREKNPNLEKKTQEN